MNEPRTHRMEIDGQVFEFALSSHHEPNCPHDAKEKLIDDLKAIVNLLEQIPADVKLEPAKVTLDEILYPA